MEREETQETEEGEERTRGRGSCGPCSVLTVICCFLVNCTLGFSYTFGNINPYMTSYLRNQTANVDYTDTLWLSQASNIATCSCGCIVGQLANRMPLKLYMLLGILINAGSTFGTYWAMQKSFALTVVTYGVLGGLQIAILYPTSVRIVVEWFPRRKGLVSGLILMGFGAGSFAWNNLTTWYINGKNLQPDLKIGEDVYYTQPAVLDKVPPCFLVIGIVFSAIQGLSILLIRRAPSVAQIKQTTVFGDEEEEEKLVVSGNVQQEAAPAGTHKKYGAAGDSVVVTHTDNCGTPQHPDYSPMQVLKSRVFWTLWLLNVATNLGTLFFISLYKAYGQTFISDDHFLTMVASISAVCNASFRPLWGMLGDKYGKRIVTLIAQCLLACLVATFVTCEWTGKVAYLFWVCAIFAVMCGFFTLVITLVLSLFGSHHSNVNLGLLDTCGVIGSIISTLIAPKVKDVFGWHGIFFVGFGGIFISVLLNMSLSVRYGNSIPRHMHGDLCL